MEISKSSAFVWEARSMHDINYRKRIYGMSFILRYERTERNSKENNRSESKFEKTEGVVSQGSHEDSVSRTRNGHLCQRLLGGHD